jgi:hypothetical protein
MGRLINNGQKLKKGLFKGVEFAVGLKKRVLICHNKCVLVLIGRIVGSAMKIRIDKERKIK